MKSKILMLLLLATLSVNVFADRPLESTELDELLRDLTDSPVDSWINYGTITANAIDNGYAKNITESQLQEIIDQRLQEYADNENKLELIEKLQAMKIEAIPFNVRYEYLNKFTMTSDVSVQVDNGKFLWSITVTSRENSITPSAELEDNYYTNNFKMFSNQERLFVWDSQKYTTYFKPINHAIITDNASAVNGPLTAGLIKWGYGIYSYENLSSISALATEIEQDGKVLIKLELTNANRNETILLDPAKDNAVISYNAVLAETEINITNTDFQQISGKWIPFGIAIEKFDITGEMPTLLSSKQWQITSVTDTLDIDPQFQVEFDYDAFIEDYRYDPILQYYNSPPAEPVAVKNIIDMKYRFVKNNITNCAFTSLGYIFNTLNIEMPEELSKNTGLVSLAEAASLCDKADIKNIAVNTDLESLKNIKDAQIILHLPEHQHFVVLSDIDDNYVRIIDLSSNRIIDRVRIEDFKQQWKGTALLVSKQNMNNMNFAKIDTDKADKILGTGDCERCGSSSGGGEVPCGSPPNCGYHTIVYARKSCVYAPSGSCSTSSMISRKSEPCEESGGGCVGTGNWTTYYGQFCG